MGWTLKPLLTPDQVAELLHRKPRSVLALDIPKVRIGKGKGTLLFREEDVEAYVRSRVEYSEAREVKHGGRVQKGQKKVGVQGLPSRAQLQAVRLGHQDGSA